MRSAFRLPALSLRTRLLVLLVALAVAGLAAADFASYRALHNYLYDRVDQQLESAVAPFSVRLSQQAGGETEAGEGAAGDAGPGFGPRPAFHAAGGPAPSSLPSGTYSQLRTADGEVLVHSPSRLYGEKLPLPQTPADLEPTGPDEGVSPITVGERGGGSEQFRLVAVMASEG